MQLSKAKHKFIRSLHQKKYRLKYNKFLVEGDKIVGELLAQRAFQIELIAALPAWVEAHPEAGRLAPEKLATVQPDDLARLSCLTTPNQVLAVVSPPDTPLDWEGLAADHALYLDGIRDPSNLGAILRVADWFGIPWVLGSTDCVEPFNPKVVQASMGAVFRVHTAWLDIDTLVDRLPDWPRLGMVMEGEDIYQADLPARALLLIGNESAGLRPAARRVLSRELTIPAHPRSGTESLNAAVATGICCALLRRSAITGAS